MDKKTKSIFFQYYTQGEFIDKYKQSRKGAVDVIIPVIHTNELWQSNLFSFYREIPIHNLLIADGGCIDDSIEIVKKFPRVKVLNHRKYKSLGYSLRKLIEEVKTDWFIYLHSDVYLPEGWFDVMKNHQAEYDWFGCSLQHTVLVEYPAENNTTKVRPFMGSQMGKKEAFIKGLKQIDDDFVYRQEEFVFADMVEKAGYIQGKVEDTFHYHQTMYKASKWERKVKKVTVDVDLSPEEELRTHLMQAKGFIKYLDPNPYFVAWVESELASLLDLKKLDWNEFQQWTRKTNPKWLPHLKFWRIQLIRIWQNKQKFTNMQSTLLRLFFGKQ
jgi:glycosyltransferase involved in cell wall biosynthesis